MAVDRARHSVSGRLLPPAAASCAGSLTSPLGGGSFSTLSSSTLARRASTLPPCSCTCLAVASSSLELLFLASHAHKSVSACGMSALPRASAPRPPPPAPPSPSLGCQLLNARAFPQRSTGGTCHRLAPVTAEASRPAPPTPLYTRSPPQTRMLPLLSAQPACNHPIHSHSPCSRRRCRTVLRRTGPHEGMNLPAIHLRAIYFLEVDGP